MRIEDEFKKSCGLYTTDESPDGIIKRGARNLLANGPLEESKEELKEGEANDERELQEDF